MRTSSSWMSVGLTVMAGLVGGALAGGVGRLDARAATRGGATVTAQKFVLVDATGRQRAALQVMANGLVDFSLQDAQGSDRAKIGVEANGSTSVGLFDAEGHRVVTLGEEKDGHTGLLLYGPGGR